MLMRINSVRDQMGIEKMYIYMYMYMCIYMYMTVWCMHVGFHKVIFSNTSQLQRYICNILMEWTKNDAFI